MQQTFISAAVRGALVIAVASAVCAILQVANAAPAQPPELAALRAEVKAKRAELTALRAANREAKDAKAVERKRAELAKIEERLAKERGK